MTSTQIVVLALSEVLSAVFIVIMWRRHVPGRMGKDIQWTVLLLLPLFGPVLWGAYYGGLPRRSRPHGPAR